MENDNHIYLVTGVAGYLGLTVTKQLIAQGAKVRAFILPNDPARRYLPAEVEVYEGDLTNKESMLPFFTLPEGTQGYVLHIASIVSSNPEWSKRVFDVNVGVPAPPLFSNFSGLVNTAINCTVPVAWSITPLILVTLPSWA